MSSESSNCCNKYILGRQLDSQYPGIRQYGARYGLHAFFWMNLINYADRFLPSSVQVLYAAEFRLNDLQTSLPIMTTLLAFVIFAMFYGLLSDSNLIDRRLLLFSGVFIWSLTSCLAAVAQDLNGLIATRIFVGLGEAAYGTIAPPMISDYFPIFERNGAFSVYFLAVPVGVAVAFAVGAKVGAQYGWRIAFIVMGLPGLVLALLALFMTNPIRGINEMKTIVKEETNAIYNDDDKSQRSNGSNNSKKALLEITAISNGNDQSFEQNVEQQQQEEEKFSVSGLMTDIKTILSIKPFLLANAGLATMNFGLGGLSSWYITYLVRFTKTPLATCGLAVAMATLVGGVLGAIMGAKLSEFLKDKIKNSFFFVPAICSFIGAIFCIFSVNTPKSFNVSMIFVSFGLLFIWTYVGPIATITLSCVPPRLRSRSTGLQIVTNHIFGVIIAPPIIGAVSDRTGSLQTGLQLCWIFILLSGVFWFLGYFLLPPMNFEDPGVIVSQAEANAIASGGRHRIAPVDHDGLESASKVKPSNGSGKKRTFGYWSLLIEKDPIMVNKNNQLVLRKEKNRQVD